MYELVGPGIYSVVTYVLTGIRIDYLNLSVLVTGSPCKRPERFFFDRDYYFNVFPGMVNGSVIF